MRKKIIRYSLLVLIAALVIIQFFQIDKTNPESIPAEDFMVAMSPPEDVKMLLKNACYDCHSHHTVYPWYSNIAPVSWWLKEHVNDGRKHLNFSIWTTYSPKKANHKLEECFEMVEESEMPLKSYLITHGEARLSDADRLKLVAWFKAQYGKGENEENEGNEGNEGNEEHEEEEHGEN